MPLWTSFSMIVLGMWIAAADTAPAADDHPIPKAERQRLHERLDRTIGLMSRRIVAEEPSPSLHSLRGDAYFFRGRVDEALADYERMVELDERYARSHWRRGIVYQLAGRHADAFRQFDVYHDEDAVDREGGIWRYFAQCKRDDPEKARAGLQQYSQKDREPFNTLYEFFQGELTADEVLAKVEKEAPDERDKVRQMFYAHLYLGLDHAVAGRHEEARRHLRQAVENEWGRSASYGPQYMWHVGRVQYDRLPRQSASPAPDAGSNRGP